ncbi:DNA translocase FtsK 4TM domain-containing protein [Sulfitobacter sp. D35]|uniref:DNA translocase FtsK 4TM domain-containing protein n=1 Tax=Sulfitobacter sp. D35 TaxID=3083252 RepID=UPI00296EF24C|nr:DNA translocase FtsK 4TM domain-containing protein [Sulfitobacter sp. D35]MDW4498351.1 DNA translocase FtsK 4TM domain-containing protein [Sulfitobacter sp. D35]
MAYQTRGRDPLLDSNMAEAIEKRGKELLGLGLIALGCMTCAMIATYTPDDPNWMVSTDAPVQNWMGRTGASIAAPLFMIVGWGAWAVGLVLLAWGLRFALHIGEDRAIGRLIFAPIAIALCSVYAATLTPDTLWMQTHSFGLGGLFGDTVMGALLTALPIGSTLTVKLMSVAMAAGILAFGAFVLGFTRAELKRIAQFLLHSLILAYATLLALLRHGISGAATAAKNMSDRHAERRARAAEAARLAEPQLHGSDSMPEFCAAEPEPKPGFLARVPGLIRRPHTMPEPELVEYESTAEVADGPGEERIRAKIADVIRTRARSGAPVIEPEDKPLTKGRGRGPDPLLIDSQRARVEPPLTGAARQEPPLTLVRQAAPNMSDAVIEEDEAEEMLPLPEADAPAPSIPLLEPKKVVQPQARKPVQPSSRARSEAQPSLSFDDKQAAFELPPLNLLENPDRIQRLQLSDEALEENARMLESVLDDYGVKGEIVAVRPGPVVTMYELEPAPGLKASRVIGLADDIARSMAALSARVSTVPGRSVIGIELPNEAREKVVLREILAARDFGDGNHRLPLALGKDIGGDPVVANLAKMPHLLIAGTTGSGKSVAINTMILSLLYKLTPEDCRMIMIDPKMLELSVYDGIPHLLSPVVTDPKKAVVALKWVVGEMEERYRKMSKMGVRNIEGYNTRVREALSKDETFSRTVQTGFDDDTGEPVFETEEIVPEVLPFIVVIVDEMADLMMVAGKEIEACIQRLAQMARASGIHLIMATQRPSVDVITGTIKANFPTRISFQVTSKIDSRTILGEMGAEQLLGMGDMLYMAGGAKITRCHGPFVSDEEVEEVVNHLKAFGEPDYVSGVVEGPADDRESDIDAVLGLGGNTDGEDALYDQAVQVVIKDRKCSTSYIQRKLAIGYNKAARLVEQMEEQGLVSAANHVGKREILVPEQA